jgi:hypothetical protein
MGASVARARHRRRASENDIRLMPIHHKMMLTACRYSPLPRGGDVHRGDGEESWRFAAVTVRNHVQKILQKLDAHSKLQAVVLAHRHKLV